MALRESEPLTQRRITSTMSSSGNRSLVRSSQTRLSSIGEKLVCNVLGRCEWSFTVVRPRQRRIVVSLTPSSVANAATGFLLRWMYALTFGVVVALACRFSSMTQGAP